MSDEEAKAVQEIAKAAGKGADLLNSAGAGLKIIFGETLEHFGGAVADWAKYYRLKNLLAVADKAQALLLKRNINRDFVPLPLQFALPILDAVSLEVEDDVQHLWAGLIANAADPTQAFRIKKVYLEILRGLQGLDVKVIRSLANVELRERYTFLSGMTLNAQVLAEVVQGELNDVQISLQTLARYGCVIDSWEESFSSIETGYSGFRVNNPKSNFRLSHLGENLVLATSTK